MKRVFVLVLDSLGIGSASDADDFGDTGANTFAHIVDACEQGRADREDLRQGALHIPNLNRLGLSLACSAARNGLGFISDHVRTRLTTTTTFNAISKREFHVCTCITS